jgi:hypothetical protein
MGDASAGELAAEAVRQRIREAGKRARAEAEARRKSAPEHAPSPTEKNGRDGPEPTRYGDWEVKGIASDF